MCTTFFVFFRYLQLPHSCAQTQTGNVASAQQFSGGTTHLLVLAKTCGFSDNDDGISTVAKEMAQQFIKDPRQVKVSYLAIDITHDQQDEGKQVGVDLYAMEDPQNGLVLPLGAPVGVRTVVSFGKAAGQYAVAVQRQTGASQKVHFACSSYSEDGNFSERAICERSDLVFGIGGGVTDNARCCRPGGAHLFTPGIIRDFCTCKQREDEPGKFRVVVFYPSVSVLGSGDETHVIPAKAVSDLSQLGSPCNLIAICAAGDDPEKLKNTLRQQGINRSRFVVRRHCRDLEARKRLLVEADLLIMPFLPSESESFGLVALQAMSAGLPILITRESGLGEALGEVLHGRVCLVEEGAGLEDWKKRIQGVREKRRDVRLQEAEKIRDAYSEHYSWNVECKAVLDKILQ